MQLINAKPFLPVGRNTYMLVKQLACAAADGGGFFRKTWQKGLQNKYLPMLSLQELIFDLQ